ncbi:MAG: single-stranded-DNA-specific exonuclease RecJ [Acidobacteriota bacterium]
MSSAGWIEAEGWQDWAREAAVRLGVSETLAMLLSRRSWDNGDLESFLRPDDVPWPDPLRIPSMAEAAARIKAAIGDRRAVLIHGDYDVDGLMGTAVLMGGLKALGGKVEAFIPSRFEGGYGLSEASLEAVRQSGASLLVTTDCGTNSREIGEELAARGVEVIVTDHHRPAEGQQPPALVVNPHLVPDHPDRSLCGTFVALQTLRQVAAELGRDLPLEPFLRLTAIATVADLVPMSAVNRRACKAGFRAMEFTPSPGLALLLEKAGIREVIRSHHIAFHVAPRFNAAGRMEDARLVLDLLLEREQVRAAHLMGRLESLNRKRKALQASTYEEACGQVLEAAGGRVVFVFSDQWHRGIIGPVAARLAETFQRSAFVVAVEGGEGVGSARSWNHDDVCSLLDRVGHLLVRYGGHEGAAGFTVKAERLDEVAGILRTLPAQDEPSSRRDVYYPIEPGLLSQAWEAWGELDPFGPGNEEPILGVTGLYARGQRVVGNRHLLWSAILPDGQPLNVIAWDGVPRGMEPSALTPSRMVIGRPAPDSRPGGLPFYLNVQAIL